VLRPNLAHTSRPMAAHALAHVVAFIPALILVIVLAVVLVLASAVCAPAWAQTAAGKPPAGKAVAESRQADSATATAAPDFFSFAERYGAAVVHVVARHTDDQNAPPEQEAIEADDPFFAFFKRAPRPASDAEAGGPRVMTGTGSGFIVSPDGLVITTAHVVDNAEEVIVRLTDKRDFKAEVLAVDPQSDVAILQIDGHNLPFVKLGDSSKVRAGEPVLSIGSPDSYQNTVTTGIVSATSRTLPDGGAFPFMQTNVAFNPDNSGGPLFNRAGEVIGIGVQIYTDGDRYEGLTFAIPIEAAIQFRAQMQAARNGTPANAGAAATPGNPGTIRTFGMQVEDVSPGLAAALGLPAANGALVDSVDPGSPIAATGVKAGDVIVQVGGKPVDRATTLAADLAAVPPATPTSLKLIRNRRPTQVGFLNQAPDAKAADAAQPAAPNATDTVNATNAAAPLDPPPPADVHAVKAAMTDADADAAAPTTAAATAPGHTADRLGLVMHALSADEKRSTGLPLGLMVDNSIGPAARAGVRPGDVVLSLNDTMIETEDQATALEAKATKSMSLLIQRKDARSFVTVKLR
jgi:serine protease Do